MASKVKAVRKIKITHLITQLNDVQIMEKDEKVQEKDIEEKEEEKEKEEKKRKAKKKTENRKDPLHAADDDQDVPSPTTTKVLLHATRTTTKTLHSRKVLGGLALLAALGVVVAIASAAWNRKKWNVSNGSTELFQYISYLPTGLNVSMTMTQLLSFDGLETRFSALILPKLKTYVNEDTPFEADVFLTYSEGNVQKTFVISDNRVHYTEIEKNEDSTDGEAKLLKALLTKEQLNNTEDVSDFESLFLSSQTSVIFPTNTTLASMEEVIQYINRTGNEVIIELEELSRKSLETKTQSCLDDAHIPPIHLLPLSLIHADVVDPQEVPSTFECPTPKHRVVSLLWSGETFLYCIDPTQDLIADTPPVTKVIGTNILLTIQALDAGGVQFTKDHIAASFVNDMKESCPVFNLSQVGGLSGEKTRAMRFQRRHLLNEEEVTHRLWKWESMAQEWAAVDSFATPPAEIPRRPSPNTRLEKSYPERRRRLSPEEDEEVDVDSKGRITDENGQVGNGTNVSNAPRCPPGVGMRPVNWNKGPGSTFKARRLNDDDDDSSSSLRSNLITQLKEVGFSKIPREVKVPCVFIHGALMKEESPVLWESYRNYWGDVLTSTDDPKPCYCSIKLFVKLNTHDYLLWEASIANKLYTLLKKAEPFDGGENNILDFMIILTHGAGKLMFLAALERNRAKLGTFTSWIALNPIDLNKGTSWEEKQANLCNSIDQWVDFRLKRYHRYFSKDIDVINVNRIIGKLRIVYAAYNKTNFLDHTGNVLDTKYGLAGNGQKKEFQAVLGEIQKKHSKPVTHLHQYNLVDPLRINDLLNHEKMFESSIVIVSNVTSKAAYDFAVCAPGKEEQLPRSIAGFLAPNPSNGLNMMTYARPQHVACSWRYPGTKSAQLWNRADISESLTDFKNQRHDGRGTLIDCQDGRRKEFGTDPDDSTSYVSRIGYKDLKNADSSWDVTQKFHKWLCRVAIEPYTDTQTPTDTEP